MYHKITTSINSKKHSIIIGISLLILLFSVKGYAQSLGDPIVNITFGSGVPQHAGPLPVDSGLTTYIYSPNTPNDGYYTIVNTTAGTNPGWYTTTDHTGNPGGYMMLVNADYAPKIFYQRTVTGLCGNTQFQFAAWIKNVLTYSGIKPNITFSIETTSGTVLGSANTGDITEGDNWIQYPFTFTTPLNTDSIVIKMTNNNTGGTGNDIVIDDITFRPYGPLVAAAFDDLLTTRTTCLGNAQVIKATTALAPGYLQKIQELVGGVWIDQTTASTATSFTIQSPANTGTYYYRIASGLAGNIGSSSCLVASNVLALTLVAAPTAAFTATPSTCLGTNVYFSDQSTSNGSSITAWLWDFGDGQTSVNQNPAHYYTKAGNYKITLSVSNSIGCTTTSGSPTTVQIIGPNAFFTAESADVTAKSITFTDKSTTANGTITNWFWDYGDGTSEIKPNNQPFQHVYQTTGTYIAKLTVTSTTGCAATYEVTVFVLNPLEITNTFTPNGDGVNDTWAIKYLNTYTGCTVDIFNRYGVKLFSSVGYDSPWNGQYNNRDVPAGVYYYVIDPKHGSKTLSGWVAVIR